MQIQSITGWHEHILAGSKYLKTASNGRSRPGVFNNELIFQLAAMAIENLIVGVSQYHHQMPVDHTLSGLVEALSPACPMDAELADRIKAIEQIDDMCSLKPVHRNAPSDMAIQGILAVGRQVVGFARQHVPWGEVER
ncbi:hypothetical protein [uncultured Desulfosarcina sp.]|uniref:hypothetical protein n=1 Tax=uncultured Desulfosarcina sp. TaxID=218289 RepID=UPI0029C923E3|nr:hypothetical protein [uncultured Desulfosarcina sp.]